MISFFEASLSRLSIHKLGNKLLDENLNLSEHPIKKDDEILDSLSLLSDKNMQ